MNEPQRAQVRTIDTASAFIGLIAFAELLVICWFGWRL
jgi:hypothetical protein